jgi:hypothetical protein
MHMRAGRWERSPAAWALAGILAVPALAEAQLFPNQPIRRQRVDCALEPPTFRVYRHEYYGYYPTCWRRFPPGWGCPSPEAPNWPAELIRAPLDENTTPPAEGEAAPAPDRGGRTRDVPRGGTEIPPLPRDERSPFNQDLGAPATPPPLNLDRPAPARPGAPAEPEGTPPFEGQAGATDDRAEVLEPVDGRGAPPLATPGGNDPVPDPIAVPAPVPMGPRLAPAASPPVSMTPPKPPRRGPILGWLTGRNRNVR